MSASCERVVQLKAEMGLQLQYSTMTKETACLRSVDDPHIVLVNLTGTVAHRRCVAKGPREMIELGNLRMTTPNRGRLAWHFE